MAVPCLRQLVACLPPQRPGFSPRPQSVGFVLEKVVVGKVSVRVLSVPPRQDYSINIPHSFIYLRYYIILVNESSVK